MISLTDARRLLGLTADADARDVRAARRRIAKQRHPDVGGDAEAMRKLNEAADIVLQQLGEPVEKTAGRGATGPHAKGGGWGWGPSRGGGAARDADVASFVIEARPSVAFEALLVVTSWIGEVIVAESPDQLDVLVLDPLRCWCRLDLVPDAGATTVGLTIAALPDEALPDIDDVRDLWVASLNRLVR